MKSAPSPSIPIALIVDDPMPCINPLHYFYLQVRGETDPSHARTIPLSLLERFIAITQEFKIRGDFSVVPFPAGLGSIAEGLEGYPDDEVDRWLELVRTHLLSTFDIHPEVLTHTMAWDSETQAMRDVSEHDWMAQQGEDVLTDYFTKAMGILKSVDLPNHGITQPCYFRGDEDAYAQAILNAEKAVNGRSRTHYFLDVLPDEPSPIPYCRVANLEADEFVVSIPSGFNDGFWAANYGSDDVQGMVDYYLSDDGSTGRIRDLMTTETPLILVTHWQSLYGNGSLAGIEGLEELLRRIDRHIEGVTWMKLSQIQELTIEKHVIGGRKT